MDGSARFDKALLLQKVVAQVERYKGIGRRELAVPGGMWGDERLKGVTDRALAWLESVWAGEDQTADPGAG